ERHSSLFDLRLQHFHLAACRGTLQEGCLCQYEVGIQILNRIRQGVGDFQFEVFQSSSFPSEQQLLTADLGVSGAVADGHPHVEAESEFLEVTFRQVVER